MRKTLRRIKNPVIPIKKRSDPKRI